VRDCLAEKRDNSIEIQIVRFDGDLRMVTLTSEVLLDENGMPERMVGICQDVTDSRRAQNEDLPGRSWRAWERLPAVSPMTQ
jgi:PAS domain S-box-containing protein